MTSTRPPDGHILVDGRPMGYWLPDGVTPAQIGIRNLQEETAK